MVIMNLLKDTRVYLAGNLEYCSDTENWRDKITKELNAIGVKVLSPTKVMFVDQPAETPEFRAQLLKNRAEGNFEEVETYMRYVVQRDLRAIDVVDFCIFNFEIDKPTFGTVHELVMAIQQQKPVFVCVQDRLRCPLWILGLVSHKYIYSTVDDAMAEIQRINDGTTSINLKKWKLLDPAIR